MAKTSKKRSPAETPKSTIPDRSKASIGTDNPGKPSDRKDVSLIYRPAVHLLLVIVLGVLAYSNTFQSPFQWDEADYIVGNPVIKDLGYFTGAAKAEGLPVIEGFKSRYIGYLTFALNYKLHGFNVLGYHVVNLAIHLFNAVLVYFLVLFTFRTPHFSSEKLKVKSEKPEQNNLSPFTFHLSRLLAFAVSLLFVSHPVQTEAVTYVFQRFASLVAMFYLLSLVMYINGRLSAIRYQQSAENSQRTPHGSRFTIIWYILSLISAVLAMKTKENAFTLPLVITLYEFLFLSGPVKKRLLRLAPFLLTMLIIPAAILGTGATAGEIIGEIKDPTSLGYEEISGKEYLFTQFRVIVTYLRLLLFPVNQNLVHDYPVYRSFFAPPVLLSFLFLSAIFGVAVYLIYKTQRAISNQQSAVRSEKSVVSSKREEVGNYGHGISLFPAHYSLFTIHSLRLAAFGVLWFFITLSVESSIIPIPMVMDEYRIYLPSIGFFLAIAAAFSLMVNRVAANRARRIEQSVKNDTQSAQSKAKRYALCVLLIIVLSLSSATYERNILWKDKVSLWEDVVSKSPSSPRAYNNLGLAYNEKGLQERSIEMYERAIALNPRFSLAYSNLGVAYAAIGRTDAAIENFTKALALNPRNVMAYANIARAYGETGQLEKAVENYSKAIALRPYDSTAYHGLGTAYVMLGRLDDSIAAYTSYVTLSPADPEAYRSRGIVYAKKGSLADAAADFRKACSLGSKESCEYLDNIRHR